MLLTHKNLYSNAENSAKHNETERGTTLGVLPLAHVYGLTISNICFLSGSSIVIFSSFDPKAIFRVIEKYKVKTFSAVPAMIHAFVLTAEALTQIRSSSLESVNSGSAPLPVALSACVLNKILLRKCTRVMGCQKRHQLLRLTAKALK